LTLAAWVVLSNHCALAALWVGKPAKVVVVKTCGCNPEPAKTPGEKPASTECCKTLHAKMPDSAKLGGPPAQFCLLWIVDWACFAEGQSMPASTVKWTGPPPRAATFSELVLQRSLQSHAPPAGV